MIFQCDSCELRQRIERDEFPMQCICGKVFESPNGNIDKPKLLRRAANYGLALARHVAGGMRVRSDMEVARILRQFCEVCAYHDDGVCTHGRCGCRVNSRKSPLVNKIRMASESCPIGKWGQAANDTGAVRVVMVTPGLRNAGAERWVAWMTRACDGSAVSVEAVLQASGETRTDATLAAEIRRTCPIYTDGQLPNKIRDHADVFVMWGCANLPESCRGFQGQRVFVNHGSREKARTIASKAKANGFRHFVAVSDMAAQYCPQPCTVIRNGVELERCRPTRRRKKLRKRWGVPQDALAVGFVGRPHKDKHPEIVAEACTKLPENAIPVFVGDYSEDERRELLAVNDRCVFTGPVSHIGDGLRILDAFVIISEHEAMNLATCEAWAAGVPVVTTAVGAVPELEREHGRMAVTVPIEASAANVADAVLYAASGENREAVERARDVVRRHYSLEAMGRRWTTYLLAVRKAVR